MRLLSFILLFCCGLLSVVSCNKPTEVAGVLNPSNGERLRYEDSVFYLQNGEYTVLPLSGKTGTYTAYPDNLSIDRTTGAITVGERGVDNQSQTGMMYKIKYQSNTGEADSTTILISGITYVDKFYYSATNDSVVTPIYNANPANPVPAGSQFFSKDKIAIDPVTGEINLNKTAAQGYFGSNNWQTATIEYSLGDKSKNASNQIEIVLYYYHTLNDVPSNVSALMQTHQQMVVGGVRTALPFIPATFGTVDMNLPSELSLFKPRPRPPCLIIIGH